MWYFWPYIYAYHIISVLSLSVLFRLVPAVLCSRHFQFLSLLVYIFANFSTGKKWQSIFSSFHYKIRSWEPKKALVHTHTPEIQYIILVAEKSQWFRSVQVVFQVCIQFSSVCVVRSLCWLDALVQFLFREFISFSLDLVVVRTFKLKSVSGRVLVAAASVFLLVKAFI